MSTTAKYMTYVDTRLARTNTVLQRFSQQIVAQPEHALEWSSDVFAAAVQHGIFSQIKAAMESDNAVDLQHVLNTLQENAENGAENANSFSTSQTTNLLRSHRTAALMTEVRYLRRLLRASQDQE